MADWSVMVTPSLAIIAPVSRSQSQQVLMSVLLIL
jgi:hypothetical protein